MTTFERGFADTERAAAAAAHAASTVVNAAKQMQRAAIDGDIAKMRKASERLGAAVDAARQEAANARSSWPYSPEEEEAYLRNEYERELMEAAKTEDLRIDRQDERLVAFPSIVRVVPTERVVRVDRKRVPGIRPMKLVALLRKNQTKKPRFAREKFLETLYGAYRLVVGKDGMGKTVSLSSIYNALTLLPGAASDYGKGDFGRDLYLLQRTGLDRVKSGARFSLPASAGIREGKSLFSTVAPDGETVAYFGIRFSEGD